MNGVEGGYSTLGHGADLIASPQNALLFIFKNTSASAILRSKNSDLTYDLSAIESFPPQNRGRPLASIYCLSRTHSCSQ